eukprot:GHVU01142226.1.p2 GENE.GHVU01142226.1~~GHVU01142226.1.p2  ORF type:complete len:142 (-),score=0.09 GHVU01142226.1:1261-1686(-)
MKRTAHNHLLVRSLPLWSHEVLATVEHCIRSSQVIDVVNVVHLPPVCKKTKQVRMRANLGATSQLRKLFANHAGDCRANGEYNVRSCECLEGQTMEKCCTARAKRCFNDLKTPAHESSSVVFTPNLAPLSHGFISSDSVGE